MALFYIFYFNLLAPWTAHGRAYVREVNRWLEDQQEADLTRQETKGG